jgi:hypothetical protein
MEASANAMDKELNEQLVKRLSQMYGFDYDDAIRRLAEPLNMKYQQQLLLTPEYFTSRTQISEASAFQTPCEKDSAVTSDSSSDENEYEESIEVKQWTCPMTCKSYLKNCMTRCDKDTCECIGDVYDENTQDLIGKWNGKEMVPLSSENDSEDTVYERGASATCVVSPTKSRKPRENKDRVLSKHLKHGQRIRTNVSVKKYPTVPQVLGHYDIIKDSIAYNGTFYSLNQFAQLIIPLINKERVAQGKPPRCNDLQSWCLCMVETFPEKWVKMSEWYDNIEKL